MADRERNERLLRLVAENPDLPIVAMVDCDIVNQDNLVELIDAEVKKLKPVTDYNGKFAARVFVQVELLGDQDPSVLDGWKAEEGKQEEENHETVEDCADL